MKKALFYITGHGFGHAARTIEVINELVRRDNKILPVISTTVPRWLFEEELRGDFEYVTCKNDVAVAQKDWATIDKLETFRRYTRFIEGADEFIARQITFLKENGIEVIVSDIPALAFAVAKKSGVPSFGISNFSWDWICAPYLEEYPQYEYVLEHLREWYCLADCLLRLPFHGDMSVFPVIEDIPIVAGRSAMEREEVVKELNLDANKKIVLLYLGRIDYAKVLPPEMQKWNNYVVVRPDTVQLGDLRFRDLVKAADVVMTKPGYGIVSQCIANRTPIMYTSRDDFREHHALVEGIKQYAHGHFVPREDLLAGRWMTHLDSFLSTEYCWPEVATNGAEVAGKKLSEAIEAHG